jgi:hypothetical protein
MAKARKANKGSKARLADKQANAAAAIAEKESKVTATKTPAKAKTKASAKPTIAELKQKALRAQAAMAKLNAQILEAENPELSKLTERLDVASKAANAHNRFLAMRRKRIRTVTRELAALKDGEFDLDGKLVKTGLKQMLLAQTADNARVAVITAEIEAARQKAAESASAETPEA